MGSFTNGVLVGLGISLLFAPMKGEEMRRLLAERTRELRSSAANNLDRQQLTSRVEEVRQQAGYTSSTGTTAPTGYTTPTTSSAKSSSFPQSGTNRSQTGSNGPGSRPNRSTR